MKILLQSKIYWLFPVVLWGGLGVASLAWNLTNLNSYTTDLAHERGKTMFNMVKISMLNPAAMASDQPTFTKKRLDNITFRIVSNNPEAQRNKADVWESMAIKSFEQGTLEKFEQFLQDGQPYFRYMGPVIMEEECLVCHKKLGYKIGDIRGGINVIMAASPILQAQEGTRNQVLIFHLLSILLITALSILSLCKLRDQWIKLSETKEQLREGQQFLASITDNMGEGCLVLDANAKITFVNPEAEHLLGWCREELLGELLTEKIVCESAEGTLRILDHPFLKTLADGQRRKVDSEYLIRRNGKKIPLACTTAPIFSNSSIVSVVINFDDITERKQAEDERSKLERQLNQVHKMEAVGQLAGGVAHEINTPIQYLGDNLKFLSEAFINYRSVLTAAKGLLSMTEKDDDLKEAIATLATEMEEKDIAYLEKEIPEALQQSIEGAKQVADIVSAMKEFAHPSSKEVAQEDINAIITNALAVSHNEWKYVAETEVMLDSKLPRVNCLRGEISQVVLNIIINAAHAIEEKSHGEKGLITVSTAEDAGWVEIRVQDTGNGIPEKVRGNIFNPFFTTKPVGKGTGQGLAISQDIVVGKHGGELFFDTEAGVGTTFVIRLPVNQDAGESENDDRGTA